MRAAALLFLVSLSALAETPYRLLEVPGGGAAPDAVAEAGGAVHVVVGRGGAAWYLRNEGGKWTDAVKVGDDCVVAGECGPRIAAAGGGVLGVVWQGRGTLGAAVSRDGGKTWTATDPGTGAAGRVNLPAIAGDGKGGLVAAWIDLATLTGEDECDLFAARLEKGKDAWTPRARVNAEGVPVCPCCALGMASGGDGRIWLTCRGAKGGMREVELYSSIDGGASWSATTVSHDEWKLTACPEAGAALAVSPDGKTVALAWRHEKFLRWARVAGGSSTVGKPLDLQMAMDDVLRAGVDSTGRIVFVWTSMGEARAASASPKSIDVERCPAPKEGLFAVTADAKQVIVVRSVK